jgi:hypothetical protein
VADEHGVELAGRYPVQQPKTVVLDQLSAARLASLWPGAARAKNGQPHKHHHNGWRDDQPHTGSADHLGSLCVESA